MQHQERLIPLLGLSRGPEEGTVRNAFKGAQPLAQDQVAGLTTGQMKVDPLAQKG